MYRRGVTLASRARFTSFYCRRRGVRLSFSPNVLHFDCDRRPLGAAETHKSRAMPPSIMQPCHIDWPESPSRNRRSRARHPGTSREIHSRDGDSSMHHYDLRCRDSAMPTNCIVRPDSRQLSKAVERCRHDSTCICMPRLDFSWI